VRPHVPIPTRPYGGAETHGAPGRRAQQGAADSDCRGRRPGVPHVSIPTAHTGGAENHGAPGRRALLGAADSDCRGRRPGVPHVPNPTAHTAVRKIMARRVVAPYRGQRIAIVGDAAPASRMSQSPRHAGSSRPTGGRLSCGRQVAAPTAQKLITVRSFVRFAVPWCSQKGGRCVILYERPLSFFRRLSK